MTKSMVILGIIIVLSPIISYGPIPNAENSGNVFFDKENLNFSKISGKIHINHNNPSLNWSVAVDTGLCTGNGTYSEPYVIEDLVIDGGGSGNCIWIENSDVYFKIENCTLYNAGTSYTGIWLYNVDNSQLIDNNCSSNRRGIYLQYSQNNTISGNTLNNNNLDGIYLYSSNNNTIWRNTASNNDRYGIYTDLSDYNDVSGNVANNSIIGINVEDSYNINVLGNNMIDNVLGILLSDANHSISGNNMNGCGLGVSGSSSIEELCSYDIDTTNLVNGKPLYYYTNEENLGSYNFANAGQVILVNCTDSIISNLDFSYCSNGIALYYCSANTILGNTGNNQRNGIMLFYSYKNTVTGNIENSNDFYGINIVGSHNNTISGNTANNNNRDGIYLSTSNNNTLSGNTANNNTRHGMYLFSSDYNNLSGNSLSYNNDNGMYLAESNNNTITQSMIKDNLGFGLEIHALVGLFDSSENVIYLNCFINNGGNAYDEGTNNHWDNGIKGNYWSDYEGLDADGDGIGDVPYNITWAPAMIQDNFPLMICPSSTPQVDGGIPGYNLYFLLGILSVIVTIVNKKVKKS